MMSALEDLRTEYKKASLLERDVRPNPFDQFRIWFDEAIKAGVPEPNAMGAATVGADGQPTNRIVLLKGLDDASFVFYTNYESEKGQHLAQNPRIGLNFFWMELERQVRIDGTVSKVDRETSRIYFQSRPRLSQIGAWASKQSTFVKDREYLEEEMARLDVQYKDVDPIPVPDDWGGYRVDPHYIEFWQGRRSRLHDRIAYVKQGDVWTIQRKSP